MARKATSGLIGSANGSALTRPPTDAPSLYDQERSFLSKSGRLAPLKTHGGKRAGSGRKPILDGGIHRTFVLTPAHLDLIDAWQRSHSLDNRSAALRHMIETAKLREVQYPD